MTDTVPASTVESRIAAFLGHYTPAVEVQLRDARARLRARFPQGYELVFDNYNALVFGISPTERTPDAFLSIAGYPQWVTLFFLHGTSLKDPGKLLEGVGKQVRSIRLKTAADIDSPAIADLISQAALPHREVFLAAPALETIIKAVSPQRRPRRPEFQVAKPRASNVRKRPPTKA